VALVLAVFLPLGYFELRRKGRAAVPIAPPTRWVQPAAEVPISAAPAPALSTPKPLSVSQRGNLANAKSNVMLGDFLLSRGEYDDAISHYQEALKLDPSNSVLRHKLDSRLQLASGKMTFWANT
jgi:tetratricopeptide (TPR) repeat protein